MDRFYWLETDATMFRPKPALSRRRPDEFALYPVPGNVTAEIREQAARFGRLELRRLGDELVLTSDERGSGVSPPASAPARLTIERAARP